MPDFKDFEITTTTKTREIAATAFNSTSATKVIEDLMKKVQAPPEPQPDRSYFADYLYPSIRLPQSYLTPAWYRPATMLQLPVFENGIMSKKPIVIRVTSMTSLESGCRGMNKIEVKVLNPEAIPQAEKMMVCAARLTQSGHKIKSLADFMALYEKPYNEKTVTRMTNLPHPTIQKFAAVNVVVVGASRRFLAQVTRHQNEVKFMSASLQYSDYSDDAAFAVPYEVMARGEGGPFLVLIISATPYQWRHMIGQRICRRNTSETRIVFLKIWEELFKVNPTFFARTTTGPFCMRDTCQEGKMSGGNVMPLLTPSELLALDYPLLG